MTSNEELRPADDVACGTFLKLSFDREENFDGGAQ